MDWYARYYFHFIHEETEVQRHLVTHSMSQLLSDRIRIQTQIYSMQSHTPSICHAEGEII